MIDRSIRSASHTLLPADPTTGASFGASLALFGGALLVGAPGAYVNGAKTGAAYLFDLTGRSQSFKLEASSGAANDDLGFSVALSGDYAVVGGRAHDVGSRSNAGCAVVFSATTGAELRTLTAAADAVATNAFFGAAVAVRASMVYVGAPREGEGAVYAFDASQSYVLQRKRSAPAGAASSARFGEALAAADGGGLYVGAPGAGLGGEVHEYNASSALPVFTSLGTSPAARFGAALALAPAGTVLLVGAPDGSAARGGAGTATLLSPSGGAASRRVWSYDGEPGDAFGTAVAIDSSGGFLVGAPSHEAGGAMEGGAYLYGAAPPPLPPPPSAPYAVPPTAPPSPPAAPPSTSPVDQTIMWALLGAAVVIIALLLAALAIVWRRAKPRGARVLSSKHWRTSAASTTAPSAATTANGRLAEGQRVLLVALEMRADVNGHYGTVCFWDSARGRYIVAVNGESLALKPANLQPAQAEPP